MVDSDVIENAESPAPSWMVGALSFGLVNLNTSLAVNAVPDVAAAVDEISSTSTPAPAAAPSNEKPQSCSCSALPVVDPAATASWSIVFAFVPVATAETRFVVDDTVDALKALKA